MLGIKRYKYIYPNPLKLLAFLSIYFTHMNIYLLRKKALRSWSKIIEYSHFKHFLFYF